MKMNYLCLTRIELFLIPRKIGIEGKFKEIGTNSLCLVLRIQVMQCTGTEVLDVLMWWKSNERFPYAGKRWDPSFSTSVACSS